MFYFAYFSSFVIFYIIFSKLPKYSDTMAEILVTTILTNFEQLQTRRTASDFHYVTLVVGDADNQVIFIQKIMYV